MTASHPVRGALLLVCALFLFACLDASIKYLSAQQNIPALVAIRYLGNLLLMIAVVGPGHGRAMITTQRTALVLLRAVSLAVVSLLMGLAFQRMPVAETTAIGFLGPMLVILAAGPLLGEKVGLAGWLTALFGFSGVMLIARPGGGLDVTGVIFALCAVLANVCYQMLSRVLAATEQTISLLFYTALAGSLIFGTMLPWVWNGWHPGGLEIVLLCALGVFGGAGHWLFTQAYRYAPASLLAPMNYLQLLWAGLLGFTVFGHIPDTVGLIGMAIVGLSGVITAIRTRRAPVKRSV
jgi:drug/metabolite transporter (DMT)-like permease